MDGDAMVSNIGGSGCVHAQMHVNTDTRVAGSRRMERRVQGEKRGRL
jgi:hypothetical protein